MKRLTVCVSAMLLLCLLLHAKAAGCSRIPQGANRTAVPPKLLLMADMKTLS